MLDSSLLPRVEDVKDYVLRYVTVHDAVGAGLSRNDRFWRHAGKAAARPRRALVELHVPRDVTCTVVDCIAPQSRARLDEEDRKAARRLVPLSLKDGLETLDVTVRAGRAADDAASRAPSMMACLS